MANDAARLGFVRRALRTLRKGAATTRQELFKGMPNEEGTRIFTKRVMNKLTATGAVRRTEPTSVGQPAVYLVDDVEKLDEIMESDETISDFLWASEPAKPPDPVTSPPPRPQPPKPSDPRTGLKLVPTPEQAPQEETFLAATAEGVPEASSVAETNRLLGELIETMHTSLQSTIYTRDAVDSLKKEFAEIKRQLEELKKAWS